MRNADAEAATGDGVHCLRITGVLSPVPGSTLCAALCASLHESLHSYYWRSGRYHRRSLQWAMTPPPRHCALRQANPRTRSYGPPALPAGEFSSLWKHGKLWIIEDDTRTHLCPGDQVYGGWPLKWCHSLSDTKSILRRNYLSASMLSHGSYLFDLEAQGWFGQAQDPATADAIWQTMGAAVKAIARVDVGSGPLPSHQVAVFFDEACLRRLSH